MNREDKDNWGRRARFRNLAVGSRGALASPDSKGWRCERCRRGDTQKSALREDKVKRIQRGAEAEAKIEETEAERERGGVRGGGRGRQRELNVERLSWIIHSGPMNDR